LGGWDLVINARTRHRDAAYRLVQYLVQSDVQVDRAVKVGTPPAVRAAYTSTLYKRAQWFQTERPVFDAATPRLTDPRYPEASAALQQQLELALVGKISPHDALTTAQQQVGAVLAGPLPPAPGAH
jgi:multiple sugar transport system substrate-binding protein